jgi:hypothetical protein
MPMLAGYEAIRETVKRSVKASGANMRRLEEVLSDSEWQLWIADAVEASELVLADVTDNNPHVMYELGLAHSYRLSVTLIVNGRNDRIPAAVAGSCYLAYDDRGLPTFEASLTNAVRSAIERLPRHRPCHAAATAPHHDPYDHYYREALRWLGQLDDVTVAGVVQASKQEFITRIKVAERRGERLLPDDDPITVASYLLSRLIGNSDVVRIMDSITRWVKGLA